MSNGGEEKIKLGVMIEFLSIKPFCEMIGMSEFRFTLWRDIGKWISIYVIRSGLNSMYVQQMEKNVKE